MRADYGVDMINNRRTLLTKDLAEGYDRIIVMAQKETVPEWLFNDPRMTYWPVTDTYLQDEPTTRAIVQQIAANVDQLTR